MSNVLAVLHAREEDVLLDVVNQGISSQGNSLAATGDRQQVSILGGNLVDNLACIEVFALGAPKTGRRIDVGYFASRALLSRLTGDASAVLLERGLANVSAPVVTGFIAEIATRYGVVVSERVAASALPVLGALGGATVNVIFINHFQRIAQGHFTIRRLEREYGAATVRRLYEELAPRRLAAGA